MEREGFVKEFLESCKNDHRRGYCSSKERRERREEGEERGGRGGRGGCDGLTLSNIVMHADIGLYLIAM